MLNDNGKTISHAPPSTPIQVSGWRELPEAGAQLLEVASEVSLYIYCAFSLSVARDGGTC